jgi:hypothetical protein
MKNLKRVTAAVVLTFVLGLSAFAGESSTPPCAPPEPGQVQTPPCSGGQMATDYSALPGETSSPPASYPVVADMAISLLESLLLF